MHNEEKPARTAADSGDGGFKELERRLNHRFRDRGLLELALTHSSVAYEQQRQRTPQGDNEQLEFLGDSVLGLVITEHFYRSYPELSEGPLTRLRAEFVGRRHLGQVAQAIGLGHYLRLGKGEEKSGGRGKTAILANALEAVIAAVYLDGGLAAAGRTVRDLMLDETLEFMVAVARLGKPVGDYKSSLQEYLQANGLGRPCYEVTSEAGPDHRKSFVVEVQQVLADGKRRTLSSAGGARKKHAEQEAARLALENLSAENREREDAGTRR